MSSDDSHAHYTRGAGLEESDAIAAKAAYESCLAGDCSHLEARINLGRLLHIEGLLAEAEAMYRGTPEPSGILYFNLGIVLEDMGQSESAVAAYREAIVHDPALADAHYNLSLLLDQGGDSRAAFRHLLAYYRINQANGD